MSGKVTARIAVERRDLWVGLYWNVERGMPPQRERHSVSIGKAGIPSVLRLYFCLIPCLPLIVSIRLGVPLAYWQKPEYVPPDWERRALATSKAEADREGAK